MSDFARCFQFKVPPRVIAGQDWSGLPSVPRLDSQGGVCIWLASWSWLLAGGSVVPTHVSLPTGPLESPGSMGFPMRDQERGKGKFSVFSDLILKVMLHNTPPVVSPIQCGGDLQRVEYPELSLSRRTDYHTLSKLGFLSPNYFPTRLSIILLSSNHHHIV